MVLAFVPIIGFVFYLVFNQNIARIKINRLTENEKYVVSHALKKQMQEMENPRYAFHCPTTKMCIRDSGRIMQWDLYDVLMILAAYLIGNISPAIILGKISGVDINKEGSGNAGTTNVLRVLGKKAALITLIVDISKGFLAVRLGMLLGYETGAICEMCIRDRCCAAARWRRSSSRVRQAVSRAAWQR